MTKKVIIDNIKNIKPELFTAQLWIIQDKLDFGLLWWEKGNLSVTFSGSSRSMGGKNNCIILRKMLNKFEKLI